MRNDISVIIPAFNAEMYIVEAIESVLSQCGQTTEIIVVNDGSTDNTATVLSKFGKNIKTIYQENAGLSASRNRGAKEACGDILAFLDADDIWMPQKLQIQTEKLASFDVVYSNRLNFGTIGDLPEMQSDIVAMFEGDIWERLIFGNFITASSALIKKSLFEKMGGFNETYRSCEDWDLWLRCSENHLIGYCPDPLVKYRFHDGSLSKNYLYMQKMRESVLTKALQSNRGRQLSAKKRRAALASSWGCSAWEAARAKDYVSAFKCYGLALKYTPFNAHIWYNVARTITGRV